MEGRMRCSEAVGNLAGLGSLWKKSKCLAVAGSSSQAKE